MGFRVGAFEVTISINVTKHTSENNDIESVSSSASNNSTISLQNGKIDSKEKNQNDIKNQRRNNITGKVNDNWTKWKTYSLHSKLTSKRLILVYFYFYALIIL
jgi:hypothetical protein